MRDEILRGIMRSFATTRLVVQNTTAKNASEISGQREGSTVNSCKETLKFNRKRLLSPVIPICARQQGLAALDESSGVLRGVF